MSALLETVPMPATIARLPRDRRGYPVPWFVQWFDGKTPTDAGVGEPEFRVMDSRKLVRAVKESRCWVCGGKLGRYRAYVVGPMCAVNRISSEPPSHTECGRYAAQVCPFLTNPKMHRVDATMPDGLADPAGILLERNPGVALVWVTTDTRAFNAPNGGVLFNLTGPHAVEWWAHGREATAAEVRASIDAGLPALREYAEEDGPLAVESLNRSLAAAEPLIPA